MMKTLGKSLAVLLLLLSLALNVYFLSSKQPARGSRRSENPPAGSRSARVLGSSTPRFDWRQVESSDYRKYIANLRSIGVPEQTIQDIIVADVGELYKLKWKECLEKSRDAESLPVTQQARSLVRTQLETAAKQLHGEKLQLLKELLGEAFVLDDEKPFVASNSDVERAMLNFLPTEKQEQAVAVLQRFDQRWDLDLKQFFGNGPIRPENRDAYLAFKRQKDSAVSAVLTPAEKEHYDLRFSQLASFLQNRFQGLPLSEPAFIELYRYAKKHDDALDFYLYDPGDVFQKPYHEASLDLWQKAHELAGISSGKPAAPEKVAQRFGF